VGQMSGVKEVPLFAQHPAKCRELSVPHAPLEVTLDRAHVGVSGLDLLSGGKRLPVDFLSRPVVVAGLVAVAEEQVSLVPNPIEELLLSREDLALVLMPVSRNRASRSLLPSVSLARTGRSQNLIRNGGRLLFS
jgi:hypothetical protein